MTMGIDSPRSVLLIGKSQRVLDDAVDRLHLLGYRAEATNDFTNVHKRFDATALAVVVFGGQVPPDRKAELRVQLSATNPRLIFAQGLSGIPGLIADQVEEAFFVASGQDSDLERLAYDATSRRIKLRLVRAAPVKVTAWWGTSLVPPDPKSDSIVLVDDKLATGNHEVAIPDLVPHQAAFATVRVGPAISAFSIADEA